MNTNTGGVIFKENLLLQNIFNSAALYYCYIELDLFSIGNVVLSANFVPAIKLILSN